MKEFLLCRFTNVVSIPYSLLKYFCMVATLRPKAYPIFRYLYARYKVAYKNFVVVVLVCLK